jgi:hypothetical protein
MTAAPEQARAFGCKMNEMSEIDAAPDERSIAEVQRVRRAGLEDVDDISAPSTAASKTETIGSTEDVHYYGEWDLFSDSTPDQQGDFGEEHSAEYNSDDDESANAGNEHGADQPSPTCVVQDAQPTTLEPSIEVALGLEQPQNDDTDRRGDAELGIDASQSELCEPDRPTTDQDGDIVHDPVAQEEYQCADGDVRRRIQVMIRVRPSSESEGKVVVTAGEKEGSSLCVQATTSQGCISTVSECTFDRVFMGLATQEDVFAAVEPSVQACLEGYNATVFAYGQTGTGKTHTLFGRDLGASSDTNTCEETADSFRLVKSSWGIVPRTLSYLLDQAAVLNQKNCQVELHLSFLQIYNDRLFDLLTDRMRQKPLLIREQPTVDGATSVTVQGLSSERITSFSSAMQIIHQGHTNRCVRETESNLSSSRSHAIVQLHVTTQCPATDGDGQVLRRARLNLVDLAGSEKWNTDVEMEDAHSQELKNINTSLSALGNCIAALTEAGRKHIPYRDSTLTRVLQDSFGGNTQSCLIATVNATQQSCDETIRTLHFADRARSVMQTIRVNEVADGSKELLMAKIQIVKLRERLESEQRRRHETRLKEHQALQRDFQEKLKGKDKEIAKLLRDNAVFLRWREEDVKKIRALESRVKDLEQQTGATDIVEKHAKIIDIPAQDPKHRSAIPTSTTATKNAPMLKTRSRANLARTGSDSGASARTYKQVLERYALGSGKHQQRVTQPSNSKIACDEPQQHEPASYHGANQSEGLEDHLPASGTSPPMNRKPRWETRIDDNQVAEYMGTSSGRHAASGLCVSPVLCPANDVVSQVSTPNHSRTCSNISSTVASFGTEWASSLLLKPTPAIRTQKQESHERRGLSMGPCGVSAVKQESAQLLKVASTGSIGYSPPLRAPVASCQKHKLAGCMLCSVNDSFRLAPAAPACEPTKAFTASSGSSSTHVEVNRKSPCDRHQLLRCFICMKGATTSSSTSSSVHVVSTSSGVPPSYSNYSIAANNSSGKAINYQSSPLLVETQAMCALHSLANCILCAGVKAMTRKAVAPTPQASPAKGPGILDARSGGIADERTADRFRRYTLDERILQAKLASHW